MSVPYTTKTGIQIGVRYLERSKRAPIDDPDMQYLQEALLATPQYIASKRRYQLVMAVSTLVLIFALFSTFLFS
jgi:hypothetical protein